MDWGEILTATAAIIGALSGVLALIVALKKSRFENEKTDAETDEIHAKITLQYAKQVAELNEEIKGLRLDITQVRRENEAYRLELVERDGIIADLQRWAEQLVGQLAIHAPNVKPAEFVRRKVNA